MEKRRRTKLDDSKRGVVCKVLEYGGTRRLAADFVGCHVSTLRRNELRDEEFARALKQAVSRHEILNLKHINLAAMDVRHWRAAVWALERTYPDRYAKRNPRTVTIEQLSQVLTQFADVVLEEVPEASYRQRIMGRLKKLTQGLQTSPAVRKKS